VLAAAGARIGDGHAKFAIVPAGGASIRLIQKIPVNVAKKLFYTADLLPAEDFLQWGLVNEIVPRSELMARAVKLARKLAEQSPEVLTSMKRLVNGGSRQAVTEGQSAEIAAFSRHLTGKDLKEGLSAFAQKRDPHY